MGKTLFVPASLMICHVFFFLTVNADAKEQDRDLYRIETVDGNVFIGTLVSEDDERVTLRTDDFGEVTIGRATIRRMEKIDTDRIRGGKYWFENPHSTRYFFSSNAIGLRKSQGYYQNTWIFFNHVQYGVSNNVSLGLGMVPTFLFGTSSLPVWFIPRVSFPLAQEKVHLGAGATVGGVIGEDAAGFAFLFGSSTFGTRDRNLDIGLGFGYAGGEWSETPMVSISGMTRVGRTLYLLSENYFFPGTDFTGMISAGVRWAPKNVAVDFGLVRPLEDLDSFIGFPWLGVAIPFGK